MWTNSTTGYISYRTRVAKEHEAEIEIITVASGRSLNLTRKKVSLEHEYPRQALFFFIWYDKPHFAQESCFVYKTMFRE